jgi:hypothetical protein
MKGRELVGFMYYYIHCASKFGGLFLPVVLLALSVSLLPIQPLKHVSNLFLSLP